MNKDQVTVTNVYIVQIEAGIKQMDKLVETQKELLGDIKLALEDYQNYLIRELQSLRDDDPDSVKNESNREAREYHDAEAWKGYTDEL